MKHSVKYAILLLAALSLASCSKFLNRPAEDTYNSDNFYQDDAQCEMGVNYLYNSPWFDVIRGFINVGEIFSGNYYTGGGGYKNFSVNGTDSDLVKMSASLWSVNAHCSTVYNRLATAGCSEETRNRLQGEVLTMKALAYFYLVRSFGDVPIVHDVQAEISAGQYNTVRRVRKADVYEYIILTLEKALSLLPKKVGNKDGRIDYYSAEGLLAKVYLTKAGVTGTLLQEDLDKAAAYAKDVIEHSGRYLMSEYSDVFRMKNNKNIEALISWHWYGDWQPYTVQNEFQCNLAMKGFEEYGTCWGQWNGPSVDLQEAFGVTAVMDPAMRQDPDTRRKATMMLAGDVYEYFWRDREYAPGKKGFDYVKFLYDPVYGAGSEGSLCCNTGAACVKFLWGDIADHQDELGYTPHSQASGLSTHILRLSDVYLVYCEAMTGASRGSTSDKTALDAFYAVRHRARSNYNYPTSISWEDVWKERRLELAMEGDRWYDFVRLAYHHPAEAIAEIKNQKRNYYDNLGKVYENYYNSGYTVWDASGVTYNTTDPAPNVTEASFTLPLPTEDVVFNPHLLEDPIQVDVRNTYAY